MKSETEVASKNYWFLWLAHFLSNTGKWIYYTVLSFTVYKTYNFVHLGTWIAVYTLPIILFSPLAGVVVDKYSKKKIFLIFYGAMSVLPLILTVNFTLYVIYGVGFCESAVSTFLYIANRSYVKETAINYSKFVQYHSWLVISQLLPNMIGAGIGGLLIYDAFLNQTIFLNCIFGLLSIGLILLTRHSTVSREYKLISLDDFKEGLRYLRCSVIIKTTISLFAVLAFFYSFLNSFFVSWSSILFPENAFFYATSLILGSLGVILGTLVSRYYLSVKTRGNKLSNLTICIALTAIFMTLLSFASVNYACIALFFLINLFYAAARNINNITIAQHAPSSLQGRLLSLSYLTWNSTVCLSVLVGGYIGKLIGIVTALRVLSVLFIFVILLFFLFFKKRYENIEITVQETA